MGVFKSETVVITEPITLTSVEISPVAYSLTPGKPAKVEHLLVVALVSRDGVAYGLSLTAKTANDLSLQLEQALLDLAVLAQGAK